MNNLYKNNLKFIRSLSIDLYNKIESTDITTVRTTLCRDGKRNLTKIYNHHDYTIHSSYDPIKQAKDIADYALDTNSNIVFLFGMGLGYELIEMIRKDSNKRYFIVEPDREIFKVALETMDITFLKNNNIYFIQDDKYENIVSFMESMILNDKSVNIRFITLPSYEVIYYNLMKKINEFLHKWINVFAVSFRTNLAYQRQWFQNYVVNLKYLTQTCSVKVLENEFKGVPAIIVGAGPSLTYNFEYLKKITDKAIIVGAGTGLTVLEKNKIRAHIAGAIDGTKLEEKIFENLDTNKDTTLFYSNNVYYTVPEMLKGNKFLMNVTHMDNFISKLLNWKHYGIYSSASISIIIANNMAKLGCNPIILLGQDFCFSRNKNYAEGVEDIKGNNQIAEDVIQNPNYIEEYNKKGNKVLTNRPFIAMRSSMENCIEMNPKTEFLNGTKDGLKIDGSEDIDFNEYVDSVLVNNSYNIEKIISSVHSNNKADEGEIGAFIKSVENDNYEVIDICKDIISCIEDNSSDSHKITYLKNRESKLKSINLYKEVIYPVIYEIDYIYKNRSYIDYCKGMYSYVLDKCLIMKNAFEYEVNGGVNNE